MLIAPQCLSPRDIGGVIVACNVVIYAPSSTKKGGAIMREFWVTIGAMVVGYLMYLGIKSLGRK